MAILGFGPRFTPNPLAVPLIKRSRDMGTALMKSAEPIATNAKNLAPVLSSDYRNGIKVVTGVEGGEMQAHVIATDWKSHFIEFGTIKTPTFAPLRRGAEAAGFRVEGGQT